jgi:site-specific DNA-methyltransferase (adenine-specific)
VHPLLAEQGWEYVQTIVWDKGISHVAGNVNGDTIRQFPVVTEVCAFYRRRLELPTEDGVLPARHWLRHEWKRAGLALNKANEAGCSSPGVMTCATLCLVTGL